MKLYYYEYTDSDINWDTCRYNGFILETELGAFLLDDGGYEEIIDMKYWLSQKRRRYCFTFAIVELK